MTSIHKNESPFIFYLTLGDHLPRTFYTFDKTLKELGFILVPVRIDQLQKILSMSDQTEVFVLSSVSDSREMKLYNEKVRPLLKFILKSKRIIFMHLGSFSKLNDSRTYSMYKNYFFMKYPLNAQDLTEKIVRYYHLRSEKNVLRWPGGKRAGLGAIA